MTNEEILEKAVKKAYSWNLCIPNIPYKDIKKYTKDCLEDNSYGNIIFNHNFAKAFWHWHDGFGEIAVDSMDGFWIDDTEPIWKQHLQQMVLEKEPLKYLEKYL